MDNFEVIDGRHTIDGKGGIVRIESVEVGRDGTPRTETLLSNGRSVAVVYRGDETLALIMINGKGARFVRVYGENVLNFFIGGVLVATIGAADVEKFVVAEKPTALV